MTARVHRRGIILSLLMIIFLSYLSFVEAHGGENYTKVHVLCIGSSANAVLIESNGRFGMVDSGEDNDYPAWKAGNGITVGGGTEAQVIGYLKSLGVTKENFDFYIGTHPHSDHIGSADEIIYEFSPKTVYLKPYDDSLLKYYNQAFDNQYVYDNAVAAATKVGATLVQNVAEGSKVDFEGCEIKFYNTSTPTDKYSVNDANELTFVVKVTDKASGKSALLPGDLDNYKGRESTLAASIGKVDMMVLGHHGYSGSNTNKYIDVLNPKIFVLPYSSATISREVEPGQLTHNAFDNVLSKLKEGALFFAEGEYKNVASAVVVTLNGDLQCNVANKGHVQMLAGYENNGARIYAKLVDGAWENPVQTAKAGSWEKFGNSWSYKTGDGAYLHDGFYNINGVVYNFSHDGYLAPGWASKHGNWYYFNKDAIMVKGKALIDGKSYIFRDDGIMNNFDVYYQGQQWNLLDDGTIAEPLAADGATSFKEAANYISGWVKDVNGEYYFAKDGKFLTGEQKIDGVDYFFEKTGKMKTGWDFVNGQWHYLDQNSKAVNGWQDINGTWYYFDNTGVMKTGWLKSGNYWYYCDNDGVMKTGWLNKGGSWYYMSDQGIMTTGRHKIGSKSYTFGSDGRLKK